MLLLLHLGLEGRFVSLKFTPSNDRVLCVYVPSWYSSREQLDRRRFFEGLQNYMENKNKGNESKIILENFNWTMVKMDRVGEIKTKTLLALLQLCLSKIIVDNWLESLWRRENPYSPEFTCCERFFDRDPG